MTPPSPTSKPTTSLTDEIPCRSSRRCLHAELVGVASLGVVHLDGATEGVYRRMSLRRGRGNAGHGQLSLVWAGGFLRGLGQARYVGKFGVEVGFVLGGGLGDDAEC